MTLKQQDSPDHQDVETIPFDVGRKARLRDNGDLVVVVNVEGDRRHVARSEHPDVWMRDGSGKMILNREWVSVSRLMSPATLLTDDNTPTGPTPAQIDPAIIAQLEAMPSGEIDIPRLIEHLDNGGVAADAADSTIAAREITMAQKKDQLIDGLKDETARMSDLIDEQEETIRSLTAALEQARAERDAAFKQPGLTPAPTAKRKIETMILREPEMEKLAALINEGWKVVFETIYVLPDPEGSSSYHFIRLEREVQHTAHPPQEEARATRLAEIAPSASDETPHAIDEDLPPTSELAIRKPILTPVLGTPPGRTYEAIDPADIDLSQPLADNIYRYGPQAVAAASDLKVKQVAINAMLRYQEATHQLFSTLRPAVIVAPEMPRA